MDDNRVVAVLFTIQLMLEKYAIEYIMVNKNGKYTRRKYNLTLKDWWYQKDWYQEKSEFKYIETGTLSGWYYKNKNILTVPDIFELKDMREIYLEVERNYNHGR